MKAVVYERFGPPEVLHVTEIPEPSPRPSTAKVRIHATSINAIDVIFRSGQRKGRMLSGIFRPRLSILGFDFAGEVVALGDEAGGLSVGDRVVGISRSGGANAQYLCVEPTAMTVIPDHIGYVDAAALAGAGSGALIFLRATASLAPGRRVLIVGASGGLGTFAVQLAHHYGAKVTGVCSTRNMDLVRSLGADDVIDYTRNDPTDRRNAYDVIFDTVAVGSFGAYREALRPGGVYSTTVARPGVLAGMALNPLRPSRRRVHFMMAGGIPRDDLQPVVDLAATGSLKSVIELQLPLDRTVAAHRHYETGHTRGKIVVTT
ncbi:MAG: NAD(P)-dependent alcohol dehydrogenase [Actinobacteria bacterium]|nr:NAD(P)-dependent alcohol dehydrogenase [Actinomycetota bacterium]